MALSKNIHFEVLGLKGTSWSILQVLHDEEKALKLAESKWGTGAFKAVKVVRERLNPEDGTYRTADIYMKGKEPKVKERKGPPGACWKPGDLYSYEGRRTLTRLLQTELERWQITALELTHVPDHYYRLDDTGVALQNAVQKAAIAQVKDTEFSIQDRMKDIYALITIAIDQLKEFYKDEEKIPNLTTLGMDGVIKRLEKSEERSYLLTLSIVQSFIAIKTIPEKLKAILDQLKPDHPAWVLGVADSIIAELIASPSTIRVLVGEDGTNIGKTIADLSALSRGSLTDPQGDAVMLKRLNALVDLGQMRQTTLAIYGRLAKILAGRKTLSDGSIRGDLQVIDTMIKTLRGPEDEKIGDFRLIEAIDERCARSLNQENITNYLSGEKDPFVLIDRLLQLDPLVHGETAKRRLSSYILPIVSGPDYSSYFRGLEGNYLERMKGLSRVQRTVIRSSITEEHKKKLVGQLDEFCAQILEGSKLLQRLHQSATSPALAGKKLIQLMAGGYFTIGNASRQTRDAARKYMRLPNFIEQCMEGDTDAEKAKSVMELQQLMVKAGMSDKKSG